MPLPFSRRPSQARIRAKRFRALGDSVRASAIGEVDYILLVEVMAGTRGYGTPRGVGGIHLLTAPGAGEMAHGRLRNSMDPIFREIRPRTLADVRTVLVEDLPHARKALMDTGRS